MKNILKTIVCALTLTMLLGFACAEEYEIVSNDTILISVDDLKAAGVETIDFDFDFSATGSYGGGAVGYNTYAADGVASSWTQTDWSNEGTTSISIDVADLWVNETDPTDLQNIQVQVWWNAGEAAPIVLTVTKTGTENHEIISNDTILVSVDDLKAQGIETITFDFDFSATGSYGGGAVGYNTYAADGVASSWTQTDWSNEGTTSITVDVDDLWVNETDPTDLQNIQVQVWWNAGEAAPITLTITKVGAFNVVEDEEDTEVTPTPTPEEDEDVATEDDATVEDVATEDDATTEQPATGDNGIVIFAVIAVIALAGVVVAKKARA